MRRFITGLLFAYCLTILSEIRADEIVGPWNLTELKQTPVMRWEHREGPVHSLIYSGPAYRGQQTEVFAFYASPATIGTKSSPDEKYPGVVLIHGGGGTAFAEWVHLWAERGYAAIAMDLAGYRTMDPLYDPATGKPILNQAVKKESRTRLTLGGPDQGHQEKFNCIGGDISDDWPYHAASNVILAHSLLRSFPEVDADHTAVTGISWGGYTTCLVASLDDRFKAAVPVYGCGFLHEGESVQKPSIDRLADRSSDWVKAYDPSSLLPLCKVPILFVNGTNDVHYPLDSYQKTFDVVGGPKQMRIEVKMGHSHPAGWAPKEIGLFIDTYCRQGTPLPSLGDLKRNGTEVIVPYTSQVPLKSAELCYTTDKGLRSKRNWHRTPAKITQTEVIVSDLPQNANTWFVAVTDERHALITTPVQFVPEK